MVAVLKISNGTTTIDLLNLETGFQLMRWERSLVQYKGGGIYQDNPLSDGRRLSYRSRTNAIETMTISAQAPNQDALVQKEQQLIRLLEDAVNYFVSTAASLPVYLIAQSSNETYPRYAVIYNYKIEKFPSAYEAPFIAVPPALSEFDLVIERGEWMRHVPGSGTAAAISNVQQWKYNGDWNTLSTSPTGIVHAIITIPNALLCIAGTNIYKSTNNGASWSVIVTSTHGNFISLYQMRSSRRILAFTDGDWLYYSDDNAISWSNQSSYDIISITETDDGTLYGGELDDAVSERVFKSTDGLNWTGLGKVFNGEVRAVLVESSGRIWGGDITGKLLYRDPSDASWTVVMLGYPAAFPTGTDCALIKTQDGTILFAEDETSTLWRINYNPLRITPVTLAGIDHINQFLEVYQDGIYVLYASCGSGANGQKVIYSLDSGKTWQDVGATADDYNSLVVRDDGVLLAGANGTIYQNGPVVTLGNSSDAGGFKNILTNYAVEFNLTDVKVYDNSGPTYTDEFPASSFPFYLLPMAHASLDSLYIGVDTSIADAPFQNVVFYLKQESRLNYSTMEWQYWNGAAWATLPVNDNTNTGSNPLQKPGLGTISFVPPTNWAATAIDGVTAYWVRYYLLNYVGAAGASPQQDDFDLYIPHNMLNISATTVPGDIPAIGELTLVNMSDIDGGSFDFSFSRVLVGMRTTTRSERFRSNLPCGDRFLPDGISSPSLGVDCSFATHLHSPTGRAVYFNPSGALAMDDRITYTIPSYLSWKGKYRIFLRGIINTGPASEITARVVVEDSSNNVLHTGQNVTFQTTSDYETLDLGIVSIYEYDTKIIIQLSADSAAPDVYLYDLFLMPADEWLADVFTDDSNLYAGEGDKVVISSLQEGRQPIQTRIINELNTEIGTWRVLASSPLLIPHKTGLTFYFLFMQQSGSAYLAPSPICVSAKLEINPRYTSNVGSGG